VTKCIEEKDISSKTLTTRLVESRCKELYGYTVHQQYPTLYCPTNAHNIKKT